MIIDDYLNLVTSEHRQKPNYIAMISLLASVAVQIQNVSQSMIPKFDIDIAAGQQLDIIGQWVGITRNVNIPINSVYFSWDGSDFVGWDYGTWQSNLAPSEVTVLPDDAYRTLIRAKIAANAWDGTTDGAYAIWSQIFPTVQILIQDHQNMSYDLALVGGIIDSLTLALIVGGYIPLKPEGVRVDKYYVASGPGPAFGWDVESSVISGWDEGSWLREMAPL